MSTAAIRLILQRIEHDNLPTGREARDALAEVEAIEKAARDYLNEETHDPSAMYALLERIAAQRAPTAERPG